MAPTYHDGQVKNAFTRDTDYQASVRAYRQLARVLREQGLGEEASHFAFRGERMQEEVLRRNKRYGGYIFAVLSRLLAGYGYRLGRSFGWYVSIVIASAFAYYLIGLPIGSQFGWQPLLAYDAFIGSVTAFHGRGLFGGLPEGDWRGMIAAIEAVCGLVIEVCFIVTFTQRFFGK